MSESRLYRVLLRLFPREFRGDFGEQMAADFRDQQEEAATRRERARLGSEPPSTRWAVRRTNMSTSSSETSAMQCGPSAGVPDSPRP